MAAEPKNPFFEFLIHHLTKWNVFLLFNYPTVFFSTGPMFLNMMYCKWTKLHKESFIRVLSDKYYNGYDMESFVKHYHGSSWHSWDAGIILWVWDHIKWVMISCIGIFILCFIFFVVYRSIAKKAPTASYHPL